MKMGYLGLGINKVGKPTLPKIILPLKENLEAIPKSITPTFERTTTATYTDGNGIVRGASIDEPRFEGVGVALPEGGGKDGRVIGDVIVTKRGVTGNIGTVSGGVTIEDGAMVFDGVDGGVDVGAIEDVVSISFWFNASAYNLFDRIISSSIGDTPFVYLTSSSNIQLRGTGQNDVPYTLGTLKHIYITRIPNQWTIYVDGQLHGTTNSDDVLNSFLIGNRPTGDRAMTGSVYSLLAFNRALSQAEITEIYNTGKDSLSPIRNGLVSEYSGQYYDGTPQAPTKIWDTSLEDGVMVFDGGNVELLGSSRDDFGIMSDQSFSISFFLESSKSHTGSANILSFRRVFARGMAFQIDDDVLNFKVRKGADRDEVTAGAINFINHTRSVFLNYDGDTQEMNLYVDNVLVDTKINTLSKSSLVMNPRLGGEYVVHGNTENFYGKISQVRIYNKTLTPEEISQLHNGERITDGLVAEYSGHHYEGLPNSPIKIIDTAKADFEVMFDGDGYLSESQRTNHLHRSENFTNEFGYWRKFSDGYTIDSTDNIAPDGSKTATLITTIANETERTGLYDQSYSPVSGVTHTTSIYLKGASGGETLTLNLGSDGQEGEETLTLTTDWVRYDATMVPEGSVRFFQLVTSDINTSHSFYIWGAQLEQGTAPTSYIPTTSSAVTRTADNLQYDVGNKITQGQGTLYAQFDCFGIDTSNTIFELVDDVNNKINISLVETTNLLKLLIKKSAQTDLEITSSAITFNQKNKLAVTYADNLISFFLNGVKVGDNTNRTIPENLQNLIIGAFNGRIKHIKYYKEPISDIKAITMTQVS